MSFGWVRRCGLVDQCGGAIVLLPAVLVPAVLLPATAGDATIDAAACTLYSFIFGIDILVIASSYGGGVGVNAVVRSGYCGYWAITAGCAGDDDSGCVVAELSLC